MKQYNQKVYLIYMMKIKNICLSVKNIFDQEKLVDNSIFKYSLIV